MIRSICEGNASWAERTYEEIKEIGEKNGSILIIPVGSIEQHGTHMPVATDTILVEAVAKLGTERVTDDVPVLVTPAVWSGFSPHHMPFGGTLAVGFDHLLSLLEDIAAAATENEFDAVMFLNGHGGNTSLINGAVSTVGNEHSNVEILGLTYFQLATSFITDIRDSNVGGMNHAGEFETSLMLYLRPELVNEDRIATHKEGTYDKESDDIFDDGPLATYRTFDEYSATGALGAPDLATAEKGEQIYNLLGDEMEDILLEIHEHTEEGAESDNLDVATQD